ncbi:helix-turn-helix domain-containing protein [Pseudomonas oryzihabitans]|uniref:helix-turn-helix domain-containing protein n=1 Tax=Pseudomonas oryzihabitans TaxID=47885 RepID=UPI0028654298|nr:helix-turn-helix domain-containing protein [Pseudomonas psychrotolerans]MDR6680700.1 DNA-binding transcriptional MerR regulator [Pseudomonas psychrotolerans]
MELDIGEVARRSGVTPSALRYYESRGLIRSIGRRGLRRVFAGEVLERLALIGLGRTAGFSLDELADLIHNGELDRGKLAAKADELDLTLRRLTALRDGLRHAAVCPAPRHLECPQFQRLLRVTQRRSVQVSNKGRK